MNAPDLETRIRSYYRTCEPEDSARLMLASQVLLDDARRLSARRVLWGSLRLVATLAAAVVLLAVLVLPRLGGHVGGGIVGPVPLTGSTFDLPAALNAQVDEAGLMRSGGIWAVQGSYFLTSTDNGATWRAGTFPSPSETVPLGEIFVLDQDHAWVIESNWVNGSLATPSVPGGLFVLDRTANGGRTWQSTTVSGDSRCDWTTMSFVDTNHGFIMCSVASTPGPNGPVAQSRAGSTKGSGTVLRTDDGGSNWLVVGSATGLGSQFTASDANTLWSAPDNQSSQFSGAAMYVSRDAGLTWSAVGLPDLGSLDPNTQVDVQDGPVFWDSSHGAFAVSVWLCCSSNGAAIWFYQTADGGRSWSVFKEPKQMPVVDLISAVAGKAWAVVGDGGLWAMNVSGDQGASWTGGSGSGMPDNTTFLTLDLIDKDHGIATVFGIQGTRVLMQTSDGGRTWHPANFGDARAKLGANSGDVDAVKHLAVNYTTMATKNPPTAWNMLSAYSQRVFGSESAFETAMVALGKRTNYALGMGEITNGAAAISQQKLGPGVWGDLNALADMSRAYAVAVTFPSSSEPPETIVIAPLSATGDWRVWVVTTP